jgi:hypothetical protein
VVAAMDGRLYAVGGRIDGNYSRNLTSNEAYDPATGRWEQRAPLPTARSGIAAAVLEGRMFVFDAVLPLLSTRKKTPTPRLSAQILADEILHRGERVFRVY